MWDVDEDAPPDLVPVLTRADFDLSECGSKLIEFARVLADSGALEPSGWSKAHLIRLMVESLNVRWLEIEKGVGGKPPFVRSTSGFPYADELKVRVPLHARNVNRGLIGVPTDKRKVQLTNFKPKFLSFIKKFPVLRGVSGPCATRKKRPKKGRRRRNGNLVQALETIRSQERELKNLRNRLTRTQRTVQSQKERLSGSASEDPLHRRVESHPECPDLVPRPVRRRYRSKFYRNARSPQEKAAAERRLMETKALFAKIFKKEMGK